MQQQYMLYLADKAQGQFAEGVYPDRVNLHHTAADIDPHLFPWLDEAHQHAQRTVRLKDTLAKLGYSRCFHDRSFQRMGLQHMVECTHRPNLFWSFAAFGPGDAWRNQNLGFCIAASGPRDA
jgi:hypothetical protein